MNRANPDNEDALDQLEAKTRADSVECDFLRDCLTREMPGYDDENKVKQDILRIVVVALSEQMVPIEDKVNKFKVPDARSVGRDFNENNVSLSDFKGKILRDYLKLTKALSQN